MSPVYELELWMLWVQDCEFPNSRVWCCLNIVLLISDTELTDWTFWILYLGPFRNASLAPDFSAPCLYHLGTPVQPNLPLLPGPVGCWAESAGCMWREKPGCLKRSYRFQFASLRRSWRHPNFESPFWDLCRRRALCAWIIASPPFLQNLAHGE